MQVEKNHKGTMNFTTDTGLYYGLAGIHTAFDAYLLEQLESNSLKYKLGEFASSLKDEMKRRFITTCCVKENLNIFFWAKSAKSMGNGRGFGAHIPISCLINKRVKLILLLKRMFASLVETFKNFSAKDDVKVYLFGAHTDLHPDIPALLKTIEKLLRTKGFTNIDSTMTYHTGILNRLTFWHLSLDLVWGRFVSHSIQKTNEAQKQNILDSQIKVDKNFKLVECVYYNKRNHSTAV